MEVKLDYIIYLLISKGRWWPPANYHRPRVVLSLVDLSFFFITRTFCLDIYVLFPYNVYNKQAGGSTGYGACDNSSTEALGSSHTFRIF